jgi:hypothetical protein
MSSFSTRDMATMAERKLIDNSKKKEEKPVFWKWWTSQNDAELLKMVLGTYDYLKKTNQYRVQQASIFTRLYSGKPLYNYFQASNSKLDQANQLPLGRPTANVTYSCIDTLVSRISQDRPKPIFLTDGGHYKERRLAKDANAFIQGEMFRTKAQEHQTLAFRDCCILGNGFTKVYDKDRKICLDRTLEVELLTDFNDAYYDKPTQLMQVKLVDRDVIESSVKKVAAKKAIDDASAATVDQSPRSSETVADQIIVIEAWHLPSSKDATDGRHVIVCDHGIILDEAWKKDHFPFVRQSYNPHVVNWYAQGLAEILMPTQMELYRMLIVASQALELMGVPRVLINSMDKTLETAFNNRIGAIIKWKTAKPEFVNAQANNPEMYQYIQWLMNNAYQISGVSTLSAQGQKPAGLNSGEAQRTFMDIQSERFSALERRFQNSFTDLAHLFVETGQEIVDKYGGSYKTVFPGKNGIKEIDFKTITELEDQYVIQCYEESSLPKDPAGRQAKLSEMLAAGEITVQEFRRLSNFPDLEQSDQLANALEERILHALDQIVDKGLEGFEEIAPDNFILDPSDLATTLTVQYINLYSTLQLEEDKMDALRTFFTQVQVLKAQAAPPQPAQAAPSQAPQQQGSLPPTAPPAAPVGPASGVQV